MDRINAQVNESGNTFEFVLCGRQVELGEAVSVWYYWMDGRQLRRGECKNYRACVDFWWACMEAEGLTDYVTGQSDEDRQQVAANQELLVLAESYQHVCASKGQRSVFFDAIPRWSHLYGESRGGPTEYKAHDAAEDMIVLDPEEDQQLRAIAENRNVEAVRAEVREALVGKLPPPKEMPAFDRAFQEWMQNAICALQTGGHDGLRLFLRDKLAPAYARYRRLGDARRLKVFLNMFAYEAKIAFYTCYSNAWIGLRAYLRKNQGLDTISEHFLRLIHNQNPREDAGDVFWGQVLSLHPIATFLMLQPHHQVTLGRYLKSLAGLPRSAEPNNGRNPAYWQLVGAILIACREYRRSLAAGESERGIRTGGMAISS